MIILRSRAFVVNPLVCVYSAQYQYCRTVFFAFLFLICFSTAGIIPVKAAGTGFHTGQDKESRSEPAADFSMKTISPVPDGLQGKTDSRPMASAEYYDYRTQSGDTRDGIAIKFGVFYDEIKTVDGLPFSEEGLISPGLELIIPKYFSDTSESKRWFPDSEIVYSITSAEFEVRNFIKDKKGYLSSYEDEEGTSGDEIILNLARENSINPKILLSLLEYTSGWVTHAAPAKDTLVYPMKFPDSSSRGLYRQMMLAIDYLERGYYGWREAKILSLYFSNQEAIRLAPDLNAGTVAVLYYFSKISGTRAIWEQKVKEYYSLYSELFGDPAVHALESLYPRNLSQPVLRLPFAVGQSWCFSNGPHGAWDVKGPAAAVDLAPPQYVNSSASSRILLASATGCVVRSDKNTVMIDLDCDGLEQTGWDLFYYHVSEEGRVGEKSNITIGQKIGFASCEGGVCTGIHVHIARKYNGEWILAGGPLPLALSGWVLTRDANAGEWDFIRNGRAVIASYKCGFPNMISL
jgi:hypothetical protein